MLMGPSDMSLSHLSLWRATISCGGGERAMARYIRHHSIARYVSCRRELPGGLRRRLPLIGDREVHWVPEESRARRGRLGYHAAAANDVAARRTQADDVDRSRRIEDDTIGGLSLLDPVLILDSQRPRTTFGREAEHLGDLIAAAHVGEMQREMSGIDEVGL